MASTEPDSTRIETVVRLGGGAEKILASTPLRLTDSRESLLKHISKLLARVQCGEGVERDVGGENQQVQLGGSEAGMDLWELQERLRKLERGWLDINWPPTDASRLIVEWVQSQASRLASTEKPVRFTSSQIAEWAVEEEWADEHGMSKEEVTRAVGNTLREIPEVKNLGNRKPARWAFIFDWTELPEEE